MPAQHAARHTRRLDGDREPGRNLRGDEQGEAMSNGSLMRLSEHLTPSDGLEGVAEVLDGRGFAIIGPNDRDDVEPGPLRVEQPMLREELQRRQGQPTLLLQSDRLGRLPLPARLDLDEDEDVSIARDQINFPEGCAITFRQDPKSLPAQETRGVLFSPVAQQPAQGGAHDRVHGSSLGQGTPRLRSMSLASELKAPGSRLPLKNPLGAGDLTATTLSVSSDVPGSCSCSCS